MTPTALFVPEETVYGTVFYPANALALALTELAGKARLSPEQIDLVTKKLGFEVACPNGSPLAHPKAAGVR